MKTYIGCSGYYYNHWKERFYPEGLPKKQWLVFYSEHFNTVEINNTFYRLPEEKSVKNWYSITPPHFVFAVKGYRYITHIKKLITDDASVEYLNKFEHLAGVLQEKAGPLLWQFPASFAVNIPRLEKFCSLLSSAFHHVFEFRHPSWFNGEVFAVLEKHNHGLCIVSAPSSVPGVIRKTSSTAYIRFHGEGAWYRDNYSGESLQKWKKRLDEIDAKSLFAYFNNDVNAYAVSNAKFFISLYESKS